MIEILRYTPEIGHNFYDINILWLEKYFTPCATDYEQLRHPDKIEAENGVVIFAKHNNAIVGTCALVWYSSSDMELIKMGVLETAQGLGIGHALMQGAIAAATAKNAKGIILETHEKLPAAIHLYQKFGFENYTLPQAHFEYNRVCFGMRLELNAKV